MDDFLGDFISTYAFAREKKSEKLSELMNRLLRMANEIPNENLTETLPPHLAGMVYNMIEDGGKSINLVPILERKRKHFNLNNGVVEYIGPPLSKREAITALEEMIVEGIFIYFFAKFSKNHDFKIKYPFYSKSEPIRTT